MHVDAQERLHSMRPEPHGNIGFGECCGGAVAGLCGCLIRLNGYHAFGTGIVHSGWLATALFCHRPDPSDPSDPSDALDPPDRLDPLDARALSPQS